MDRVSWKEWKSFWFFVLFFFWFFSSLETKFALVRFYIYMAIVQDNSIVCLSTKTTFRLQNLLFASLLDVRWLFTPSFKWVWFFLLLRSAFHLIACNCYYINVNIYIHIYIKQTFWWMHDSQIPTFEPLLFSSSSSFFSVFFSHSFTLLFSE